MADQRGAGGGACGRCGADPAHGFADINGERFCHGDEDETPTCYERAQRQAKLNKKVGGQWLN